MLMGSIASGEDGDGAGDLKDTTKPRCSTVTGRLEGLPPRFARLSKFVLRRSTRRLYASACFSTPSYRNSPRWMLWVVAGRLRIREHRHAFADAGGVSRDSGFRPEGGYTRHPDTGSALPVSRAVDPTLRSFSSAIFVSGESAMRSLETWQNTVTMRKRGSGVVGLSPRKVAEKRYAPVRKVCDYKLWVRCEASRPEKLGSVSSSSLGATDRLRREISGFARSFIRRRYYRWRGYE